jgi:hypothetical protein
MCDPLSIAGLALSGAGIAANSIGQSQAAAASNRAASAEAARQAQLRQEAAAVQAHSNSLYDNFAGKQAERANDLTTYLKGAQTPAQGQTAVIEAPTGAAASTGAGTGGNVSITAQGEASQRKAAGDFAAQQAGALGDMRSFGDLLGTDARLQARDAGQIGQIGNFMKGSASVLPMELNAASHAGDTLKTLGGLAGGLGKVGVAAGTSGSTFGGLLGGRSADSGNISLPVFAGTGSSIGSSIANAYANLPAAPMTVGNAFGAAPSFASSPYRV